MFLQWMWFSMMLSSLLFACVTGSGGLMLTAALDGTKNAIEVTLRLGAGYLFFCGMMEIAGEAGISAKLEKGLKPLLRRLMPHMGKAAEAVTMNLSMNMLGLGNAATPMGLEAMKQLNEQSHADPAVRHDMYMLLILNATSLQLLPTTVLTLRAAAGSVNPAAVIMPTLACTAASTIAGVLFARLFQWAEGKRND